MGQLEEALVWVANEGSGILASLHYLEESMYDPQFLTRMLEEAHEIYQRKATL